MEEKLFFEVVKGNRLIIFKENFNECFLYIDIMFLKDFC